MRKLFLASFKARTPQLDGEPLDFEEYRLMAMERLAGESESTMLSRSYQAVFWPWFIETYPESELSSFIALHTVSDDPDVKIDSEVHNVYFNYDDGKHVSPPNSVVIFTGDGPKSEGYRDGIDGIFGDGNTEAEAALAFVNKLREPGSNFKIIQYKKTKVSEA